MCGGRLVGRVVMSMISLATIGTDLLESLDLHLRLGLG